MGRIDIDEKNSWWIVEQNCKGNHRSLFLKQWDWYKIKENCFNQKQKTNICFNFGEISCEIFTDKQCIWFIFLGLAKVVIKVLKR